MGPYWSGLDRLPCVLQVGLAGPSGSGKTAFSEKVRSFIPGITVLSMDNYNDASRLIDGNFDGARTRSPSPCAHAAVDASCPQNALPACVSVRRRP